MVLFMVFTKNKDVCLCTFNLRTRINVLKCDVFQHRKINYRKEGEGGIFTFIYVSRTFIYLSVCFCRSWLKI